MAIIRKTFKILLAASLINLPVNAVPTKTDTEYVKGKIGVGVEAPSSLLHVAGDGSVDAHIFLTGEGTTARDGVISSNEGLLFNINADSPATGTNIFSVYRGRKGNAGGTELFTVSEAGNINVPGRATATSLKINSLASSDISFPAIGMMIGVKTLKETASNFGIWSGGVEQLTVAAVGNVGIGVPSPSVFKLQVAGSIGPNSDNSSDLGSASLRFKDLYVAGNITGGNINAGNITSGTVPAAVITEVIDLNKLTDARTTADNIFLGSGSGTTNASALRNIALGINSLNAVQSTDNVGLGYKALYKSAALLSGQTEGANVAIGSMALSESISGRVNTAIGFSALAKITSGSENVAIGNQAISVPTSSTGNTAIGSSALTRAGGSNNVAVGYTSMSQSTAGSNNTALGYKSGNMITGSYNIAIGSESGAGAVNLSGSNNIVVGKEINPQNPANDNQLNIGNLIYGTGIGSATTAATGGVGIGVPNPSVFKLQVAGSIGPNSDNSSDLGSASLRFKDLYIAGNITGGNINAANITSGTVSANRLPATVLTEAAINTQVQKYSPNLSTYGNKTAPSGEVVGHTDTQTLSNKSFSDSIALAKLASAPTALANFVKLYADTSNKLWYLGDSGPAKKILAGAYINDLGFPDLGADYSTGNIFLGQSGGANLRSNAALNNIAIGITTLASSSLTGGMNLAIGSGALNANTIGAWNVALGDGALRANTKGAQNTVVGAGAGTGILSGANNILVGYSANVSNGDNQLNIGNSIYGLGMGTAAPKISIGKTNPATTLDVAGTITATGFAGPATGLTNIPAANLVGTLPAMNEPRLGLGALAAETGTHTNSAVGINALNKNTAGNGNTALGYNALSSNVSFNYNTAIGSNALALTTSSANTAVGYNGLAMNTNGAFNTSTGYNALAKNTSGSFNAAFGQGAMNSNLTGKQNTALGQFALNNNSNGDTNVAVGQNSLVNNTTGNGNTAVGTNAMYVSSTGVNNTALGYQSGLNIAAGTNNITIGANTNVVTPDGHYQLNIGNSIWGTLATTATDFNNVQIGIGTKTPAAKLDVAGQGLFGGAKIAPSTFMTLLVGSRPANDGISTIRLSPTFSSGGWSVDAGDNVASGKFFQVYDANNAQTRLFINNAGFLGVGTITPTAKLHVVGDTKIDGVASINLGALDLDATGQNYSSPLRFKENGVTRGRLLTGGTGVAGDLIYERWNAAGAYIDTPLVLKNATGYVGIGTVSPQATLHIGSSSTAATMILDNTTTSTATGNHILMQFRKANTPVARFGYFDSVIKGLAWYSEKPGKGVTGIMTDDGYLGIGTTSPATKLDVASGFDDSALRVRGSDLIRNIGDIGVGPGGQFVFSTHGGSGTSGHFDFRPKNLDHGLVLRDPTLANFSSPGNHAYANFMVKANPTAGGYLTIDVNDASTAIPALAITSDKKIGIRTTAPADIFDIRGPVNGTALAVSDPKAALRFAFGDGVSYIQSGTGPTNNGSRSDLVFSGIYGGSPWMTMKANTGNIGIGTTNPTTKLEVVGTIKAENLLLTGAGTTDLRNCSNLKTDASGNLTCGSSAGSGIQILGPLVDSTTPSNLWGGLQTVNFTLSAQSDVIVVAYVQASSDAYGPGALSLLLDDGLIKKGYYGEECAQNCGGGSASVVLSSKVTGLAAGTHALKVTAPGRPSIYRTADGGGVEFYVYIVNNLATASTGAGTIAPTVASSNISGAILAGRPDGFICESATGADKLVFYFQGINSQSSPVLASYSSDLADVGGTHATLYFNTDGTFHHASTALATSVYSATNNPNTCFNKSLFEQQGFTFSGNGSLRLDSNYSGPATFSAAFADCQSKGKRLPTAEELINFAVGPSALTPNENGAYLWTTTPDDARGGFVTVKLQSSDEDYTGVLGYNYGLPGTKYRCVSGGSTSGNSGQGAAELIGSGSAIGGTVKLPLPLETIGASDSTAYDYIVIIRNNYLLGTDNLALSVDGAVVAAPASYGVEYQQYNIRNITSEIAVTSSNPYYRNSAWVPSVLRTVWLYRYPAGQTPPEFPAPASGSRTITDISN